MLPRYHASHSAKKRDRAFSDSARPVALALTSTLQKYR